MNKKIKEKGITKKQLFISILIVLIVIFAIIMIFPINDKTIITNPDQIEKGETSNLPELTTNTINASSKLEDFYGKPSLIVFAGTYCGHCTTMVPELEKEIWNNYKLQANIWINVIDGSTGKKFDVKEIAQGYNPNLDYDEIMGDCSYVPAYVVLDKDGQEILRSCGSEKTIDEIKQAIISQLN